MQMHIHGYDVLGTLSLTITMVDEESSPSPTVRRLHNVHVPVPHDVLEGTYDDYVAFVAEAMLDVAYDRRG